MNNLLITKGERVIYRETECIVIKLIDIATVSIEETKTNIIHTVGIELLSPYSKEKIVEKELHSLNDKDWEKAKKRYAIIKPCLDNKGKLNFIKQASLENDISIATIYRWIKVYENNGLISSLAGHKSQGGIGKNRLSKSQNEIINDKIHSVYLTSSRKSIIKTIREIKLSCESLGIKPPHDNTIRNRIKNISEEERIRKRIGYQEAKYKFEPMKGHFPGANFPLSVVQIDHTLVDIILVDEQYRKAYKRPWITVAIDVYSRMVIGFYLSFDTPGALGTGVCIANSILPKEMWLESMNINAEWPCWGIMDTIHLDNAKEFRGNMLRKTCENYGINIEFRPIGAPHWGGHVERLLGTFSKEIHNLPGTTFSSESDRKNYQSEKNASFTLKEFEKWLATYITKIYHNKEHSSISMSPLQKYKEGIMGNKDILGRGIPPRINDERKTRLDFMPYVDRTIQEYGIVIDHIHYYHDVLRPYIHDQHKNGNKVKHIFKRDPRDISIIYFYDPKLKEYFEIPYRNTSFPPMSIWEYREVLSTLKKNKKTVDESILFSTYRDLNELESKAIRETRKRKKNSKKKERILTKETIEKYEYAQHLYENKNMSIYKACNIAKISKTTFYRVDKEKTEKNIEKIIDLKK